MIKKKKVGIYPVIDYSIGKYNISFGKRPKMLALAIGYASLGKTHHGPFTMDGTFATSKYNLHSIECHFLRWSMVIVWETIA